MIEPQSRRRRVPVRRLAVAFIFPVLAFATVFGAFRWYAFAHRVTEIPIGITVFPGDVILLGSATLRGMFVKLADGGCDYPHVGLADVDTNGIVWLIHADPARNGVCRDKLRDYLARNVVDGLHVLHPVATPDQAAEAVRYARAAVESRMPFDESLRFGVGTGVYCTELVLLSWESAGVPLLSVRKGDRVYPSALLNSMATKQ